MSHHITKTISNQAFWSINKHLAKTIGLEPTLVLQHLIDLQTKVFKHTDFFQSTKQLMEELSLSKHHIQQSVSKLKEFGVVVVESKSFNNKNHYTVLLDRVEELLQVDDKNLSKYLDTLHLDKNSPTTNTKFNQVLDEKLTNHLGEISPTHIEKNIIIKESNKKEINKNNTKVAQVTDVSEKNILSRLLDDLIQYEDKMKFKRSWNDVIDYGGLEKVFNTLEFDSSQKNNWNNKIESVRFFVNA